MNSRWEAISLPGFHERQNHTNNSKDVEDKEQATTEVSTIQMINTIPNGKSSEISNNVNATSEDNASDLGNLCTNKSIYHDMHDAGFFPTKIYFQIAHVMKSKSV